MASANNRFHRTAGVVGAYLAGSATADVASFHIPERCTVTEIGIIPVVNAGSNATTVAFDLRVAPGSDTGRVATLDGSTGFITTAASPTVGVPIRKFVDVECAKNSEIVVEVTEAGAASSTFIAYVKGILNGQFETEGTEIDSV